MNTVAQNNDTLIISSLTAGVQLVLLERWPEPITSAADGSFNRDNERLLFNAPLSDSIYRL